MSRRPDDAERPGPEEIPLFADDATIGQAVFGNEKKWRELVPQLESRGLPKVCKIMRGRYVPAVYDFLRSIFDREYGIATPPKITIIKEAGLVYVVGFGPYVKIGFTKDLKTRLGDLQKGAPEKLVVYGTIENVLVTEEKLLHSRFRLYRLEGEWFRKEGELTAWIEAGCPL